VRRSAGLGLGGHWELGDVGGFATVETVGVECRSGGPHWGMRTKSTYRDVLHHGPVAPASKLTAELPASPIREGNRLLPLFYAFARYG
jgi:hypothetical protein